MKTLGDLDLKAFQVAAKKIYCDEEEANERAVELCSIWENYVGDSKWNPFKVISDEKGKRKVYVELLKHMSLNLTCHTSDFSFTVAHAILVY